MNEIYLEPIKYHKSRLDLIAQWRNESHDSLRSSEYTSPHGQRAWVESMTAMDIYYYILIGDQLIGYCGLDKVSLSNRTAEISMLIGPQYRKKGHGLKAVKLLLQRAFEIYQLNLVFGEVYWTTGNWGFWSRCGFTFEGELRQRKWWKGKYYNSTMFSMTEEEWKQSSF